ncbi:MAG: hypothetical protein HZA92_09135, partial [Verrucomicrobia bacterium]|nr:hypothetical protein [Verrucomicrobiota bacterium]
MNQPPDPVPDMVDRYLRGELPADELAAFERVLREDAAARVCFRRAARLDANLRFLSEPQDQPGFVWRDEGGGAVKEAVSLRQTVSRLFPLRWLLPLAACFALIALGAWTWLSWCPVAGLSGVHGVVTVLRDGQVIPGADALALRAGDVVRTG